MQVDVQTSNHPGAGHDGPIWLTIIGTAGKRSVQWNPSTALQTGGSGRLRFDGSVGRPRRLQVRVEQGAWRPAVIRVDRTLFEGRLVNPGPVGLSRARPEAPLGRYAVGTARLARIDLPDTDRVGAATVIFPTLDGRRPCGAFPVVLFGHGKRFGPPGTLADDHRRFSSLLGRVASAGFIILSPDHHEAPTDGKARLPANKGCMDALLRLSRRRSRFKGTLWAGPIGVIGHSLGASGGLAYARERRNVGAFVSLAGNPGSFWTKPGSTDVTDHNTLATLKIPSLHVIGTADTGTSGGQGGPQILYCGAHRPRYRLTLEGANHFGYSDDLAGDDDPPATMGRPTIHHLSAWHIAAFLQSTIGLQPWQRAYLTSGPDRQDPRRFWREKDTVCA